MEMHAIRAADEVALVGGVRFGEVARRRQRIRLNLKRLSVRNMHHNTHDRHGKRVLDVKSYQKLLLCKDAAMCDIGSEHPTR